MNPVLNVLLWFLIPFGFGIPKGVLLAGAADLSWTLTTFLYVVSDVILAFVFEPILLRLLEAGGRVPALARVGAAMRRSMEAYGGPGGGPFALVLIAFCIDPMTGRAATIAAGHGFVSGWTLAIVGDTLSFFVYMAVTLKLQSAIRDPNATIAAVLFVMALMPVLVRKARGAWLARRAGA